MRYKFDGDIIKMFTSKSHIGTYNKKTSTIYTNDLSIFNK